MNMQQLPAMIDFATAAQEFLDAQALVAQTKEEYRSARNTWLLKRYGNDYSAGRKNWDGILDNPSFKAATDHLYANFMEAKRMEKNAKARMMTRYRRLQPQPAKSHLRLVKG